MSLISRSVRRTVQNNISLGDFEKSFFRHFYGGPTSTTGVKVNEETALKFSAVLACIKIISEDIGMLPCEVRKWRATQNHSKGSDLAHELPLHDMLSHQPNEEMDSMSFDEAHQSHVLSSGNGYALKDISMRGQVSRLTLLNWQCVTPQRNKDSGAVEYKFDTGNGKPEIFNREEIFHVHGLGFDGLVGYSPIRMAMEAIGLGLAAEQFAAYFYSNGANVGGFVEMPNSVKDKESMKTEFAEKFAGLGKAHKVLFLEEGMKFQKLVMPLAEAQFIETRKFQIEEIARAYRMPLHMLQDLSNATFSNIEHQDLAYVKRTLLPWVRRRELAIDTQLLTKRQREQGYFCRYNLEEWMRGDSKTRAEVNHIKRQDGIITTNEWRADDGQNPRDEAEADLLVINGNMREIGVVTSTKPAVPVPNKKVDDRR